VQRTARVLVLGAPGKRTRELWVACHGYGQLAAPFAAALAPLSTDSRVIAVPEALSRFYLDDPAKRHGPDSPIGASWMTREDRENEIADYVAYLDQVAATLRAEAGGKLRLIGFGFSQGAATISRWAATGQERLDRVVIWGGTLPHDLPTAKGLFRGAPVVLVGGSKDKLTPPEAIERDRKTLADHGVDVTVLMHDGGHSLNSAILGQLGSAQ
jgi:predicted esterase